MLFQVIIRPGMNSLNFFKAERESVFDVSCRICIMSELNMVVKTVILISEAKGFMPIHPYLFPVPEPFKFCPGPDKKLHLHLLKLPHPENELPRYNFISESFTDLCDSKRDLHPSCFLHI